MALTPFPNSMLFVTRLPLKGIRPSPATALSQRWPPFPSSCVIRKLDRNSGLVPRMSASDIDPGRNPTISPGLSESVWLKETDVFENRRYRMWRLRIFYSVFIGYASFYLTRNSFTYVASVMRQALGFSLEELGIVMSVFPLSYGFSKLIAGVLSDRFSARMFMAVDLATTGLINITFGFQTSLYAFVVLWIANGVFQATGAPPCAKLLTVWYPQTERGMWWGFWNTSHNTRGFVIPLLSGYCARVLGWRYGLIIPGVISICTGIFLFERLRDDPSSVGLPPVDQFQDGDVSETLLDSQGSEETLTPREKLIKFVVSNPYVWLLAASYFFRLFC